MNPTKFIDTLNAPPDETDPEMRNILLVMASVLTDLDKTYSHQEILKATHETQITDYQKEIRKLKATLQGQLRANDYLTNQVNLYTANNPFRPPVQPVVSNHRLSHDPEPFDGTEKNAVKRQEMYTAWKMQIKSNWMMDAGCFCDELRKLLHMSGLLKGDAHTTNKSAVQSVLDHPFDHTEWEYETGDALFEELDRQYEVVNIKLVAQRDFDKLEMSKNQNFPNFLSLFKQLAAQADKTNEQKVEALKKKVTNEIAVLYMSLPNRPGDGDFNAWASATTKIWENIQEYEHNQGRSKKWDKQTYDKQKQSHNSTPDPNAMDLDSVRLSRLTDAERQWCIDNNCCFFCRQPGHSRDNCPSKKKAAEDWDKGIRGGRGGTRGGGSGRGRGAPTSLTVDAYVPRGGRGGGNPYSRQTSSPNPYQNFGNANPYYNYVVGGGTAAPQYSQAPPQQSPQYPQYPVQPLYNPHSPGHIPGFVESEAGSLEPSDSASQAAHKPSGN